MIATYILMIVDFFAIMIISIVIDEASQNENILVMVAVYIPPATIFLNFLLMNLANKYAKKIKVKWANRPIHVKPTIAKASTFDKNIFQENLKSLEYETWKGDDINIPVYIKKNKFLYNFIGRKDVITVMIFYEFPMLEQNIVNQIKTDKEKIILGLRKEFKKKRDLYIEIASVVTLEHSSEYFKKHITQFTAQYGNNIIQDCYLLKEDNKVYVPRLLVELDCISLKRLLNKVLNVHIRQRL